MTMHEVKHHYAETYSREHSIGRGSGFAQPLDELIGTFPSVEQRRLSNGQLLDVQVFLPADSELEDFAEGGTINTLHLPIGETIHHPYMQMRGFAVFEARAYTEPVVVFSNYSTGNSSRSAKSQRRAHRSAEGHMHDVDPQLDMLVGHKIGRINTFGSSFGASLALSLAERANKKGIEIGSVGAFDPTALVAVPLLPGYRSRFFTNKSGVQLYRDESGIVFAPAPILEYRSGLHDQTYKKIVSVDAWRMSAPGARGGLAQTIGNILLSQPEATVTIVHGDNPANKACPPDEIRQVFDNLYATPRLDMSRVQELAIRGALHGWTENFALLEKAVEFSVGSS